MNLSALGNPISGVKRLTKMIFRRNPLRVFTLPRSGFDWRSEVGDGTNSSTVTAPLFWIARTFPEAPPALWTQSPDGQEEPVRDHPMLRLLVHPNEHYTGPILWMATLIDYMADGNAYWLKIRDKVGNVRELWWAPHWLMDPRGNENDYVTHYDYYPVQGPASNMGDFFRGGSAGEAVPIRAEDVVHFRFSLDPDNPLKGRSPLKSVLREVFTDDEAANFTASLLRNSGVPGLVVSPDTGAQLAEGDAELTKAYIKEKFTGDHRGEALVMSGPTKVQQFGFSPADLLLKELRRIPEERVTAVLGIPAVVAGLGAGLDRSTFTNMAEAREAAYESGIIPTQRILAEDVRWQLLSEYEPDPFMWRMGFDLSKVRVLQEDERRKIERLDIAVRGGWSSVQYAQRQAGFPVDSGPDVYLRPSRTTEVPVNGGKAQALDGRAAIGPDGSTPKPPAKSRAEADYQGMMAMAAAVRDAGKADPALLAMMGEVAESVRASAEASSAPRATDPELLAVLQAFADRDTSDADDAYVQAVTDLADAVRAKPSTDPALLAIVGALVEKAGQPRSKTINFGDGRVATVTEEDA